MTDRVLGVSVVAILTVSAHGSFTVIKGIDNWNVAVSQNTTLDFVFPQPQVLSNQYASLGVLFPEAEELAQQLGSAQHDGWGCSGAIGGDIDIHLKFLEPQYAIGAWFPGDLFAKLYWQGQLVYSSQSLHTFPLSYQFGGIISTQPFDEVVLWDSDGFVFVDDVLFSSNVPTPGAALLLVAALRTSRKRR